MAILDGSKREKRKVKRDAKLDTQITQETQDAGIDLSKLPSGPVTDESKARINEAITKGASEDLINKVSGFSESYVDPNLNKQDQLNKEQLKRSLRSQKRAKVQDVIGGMLKGFSGESIDPSKFKYSQIKKARQDQYDQYKGISQANKATANKWEVGYRDDLYKYLDELSKNKDTSELDKLEIEKQKAYIDKLRAEAERARRKTVPSSSATKDAIPTYTYQTGDGQTLKMQVPRKDAYRFNKLRLGVDSIKREKDAMMAEMENELDTYTPSWGQTDASDEQDIRDKYAPLLAEFDAKIKEQETNINNIFSGGEQASPSPNTQVQEPNASQSDDEFGNFINQYQ